MTRGAPLMSRSFSSPSRRQVSRRYKHFDWLHDRLEEKFALIPVAPLPDKQASRDVLSRFVLRVYDRWITVMLCYNCFVYGVTGGRGMLLLTFN